MLKHMQSRDLFFTFLLDKMSQTCILIRRMYQDDHLYGGHVIMLGNDIATQMEAKKALQAYPNGLQIGGTAEMSTRKPLILNSRRN